MRLAKSRSRYGQIVTRDRSRFLEDLPEHAVEMIDGDVKRPLTEEEAKAVEMSWRAKIRASWASKVGVRLDRRTRALASTVAGCWPTPQALTCSRPCG